jgi:hypothetical protein
MKRIIAGAITVFVLGALLIAAAMRSAQPVAQTPEQCLEQMFQAMKDGDVAAYLHCFTGELNERLTRDANEQTTERFAAYLRETVAPIKGRAVQKKEGNADSARLVVDRVYERRPWEYQGYRLRRESGAWKIFAIDPVELHEPPIPYGTPAFSSSEAETQSGDAEPASR